MSFNRVHFSSNFLHSYIYNKCFLYLFTFFSFLFVKTFTSRPPERSKEHTIIISYYNLVLLEVTCKRNVFIFLLFTFAKKFFSNYILLLTDFSISTVWFLLHNHCNIPAVTCHYKFTFWYFPLQYRSTIFTLLKTSLWLLSQSLLLLKFLLFLFFNFSNTHKLYCTLFWLFVDLQWWFFRFFFLYLLH